MVTLSIIAVVGAWATLALLAGEMRRQQQEIDLAREIAARKADREAALQAAAADLMARAGKSAPNRPAARSAR